MFLPITILALLNAMKIAVMTVSDVEVVRFGSELLFSIYKGCFCRRQRRQWIRAELTCAAVDGPVRPSTVGPSSHECASQFGLANCFLGETPQNRVLKRRD